MFLTTEYTEYTEKGRITTQTPKHLHKDFFVSGVTVASLLLICNKKGGLECSPRSFPQDTNRAKTNKKVKK